MAKYTSRYVELGFYVNGEIRRFTAGEYVTEDAKEIAILNTLSDASRADETKQPEAPTKPRKAASSDK